MKPNAIHPLGERLTIRPMKTASKIGSLYVPEIAKKNTFMGVVQEVGPDVQSESLLPDAIVMFEKHAGLLVDTENNIMIMNETDVMCVAMEDSYDGA